MIGEKFGRLTVVESNGHRTKPSGQKYNVWLCKCDCGNDTIVSVHKLRTGSTKSCGCIRRENLSSGIRKTHGMHNTPEYETWCAMIKRCNNEKCDSYKNYGGRGITVCNEWLDFEKFYADMGNRPKNSTIERINVNGNYEPCNYKWATKKEQGRNKRTNRLIEFRGSTRCLSELAEQYKINMKTLWARLKSGWSMEKALTVPIRKHKP